MTLTNLIGNKKFLPDFKQSIPSKDAVKILNSKTFIHR